MARAGAIRVVVPRQSLVSLLKAREEWVLGICGNLWRRGIRIWGKRMKWRRREHCVTKALSPFTKSWLFDDSSLTERLEKYCHNRVAVKLLSVDREILSLDEAVALNIRTRSRAIVRKVLLSIGGDDLVYARTILPISGLRGPLRDLVLLGEKPLGKVIFNRDHVKRRSLEIAALSANDKLFSGIPLYGTEPVLGRRSILVARGKNLLVSEFFINKFLYAAD